MSNLASNYDSDPVAVAPKPSGLFAAFAIYLTQVLLVLGVAVFVRFVSIEPSIQLDMSNLLRLSTSGLYCLVLVAALPVLLLFLFHLTTQWLHTFNLPLLRRGGAMLLAVFSGFGIGAMLLPAGSSIDLNLALVLGFALTVMVLFDLVKEPAAPGFGWSIAALLLFSAAIALLLYDFSAQQNRNTRMAYAAQLAVERDTAQAEVALLRLQQFFENDKQLPVLLKPWPFKPSADSVRNYLIRQAYQENYLFQHYRLQVFAYDRSDEDPLLLDQVVPRSALEGQWAQATPISEGIRSTHALDGSQRYLLHIRVSRMNDVSHPADIYCAFDKAYPQQTQVYSQIFYNQPYKGTDRLADYDFAILYNKRFVAEQGKVPPDAYNTEFGQGKTTDLATPGRMDAVSRSSDGATVAVVGRPSVQIGKAVYQFSILFTLATALLFLLAGIVRLLPIQQRLLPSMRGSLERRIHFSFLTLLAVGFLLLGGFTYYYFSENAKKSAETDINYRTEAIRTQLTLAGVNLEVGTDSVRQTFGVELARLAASLRIDANLYNEKGVLVFTTRDDLRRIGLLPQRMDAPAHTTLASGTSNEVIQQEALNNEQFSMKYLSVRNRSNQSLGYVGVPYRFDHKSIGGALTDFLGILASIYTFLLLAAAWATYLLARSITSPVNEIAEKIKELQLVDKNQSLQYKGDQTDELGALVGEYNRMVDKLEDSKLQLIKLEREAAWREMARQIAHDIKNPLTTMKLSMQQLERVSGNPEQAAAYLKRATGRLIEQIDSLAQTASEFSMFAQLDIKHKADTALNDIVESVYDLFTEQKDADLSLKLPDETYHIQADKNHLLRVFNNLVINAIQAIPSDRRGVVKVSLHRIGAKAIVRISDNGGGIPIEIRDRVFEPNFTTKTSGSGLGLAICKKIIEAHGGDIRFETRDNEGTDFFVELPIVEV